MNEVGRVRIRCYVSPTGTNKIADWHRDLSVKEKADTDEFVKAMQRIKPQDWAMPYYRVRLRGGEGLGELRWQSERKQHRLLGFFMAGTWYAVIGCTHKQQIYAPPECLDTAKKRKKQIERAEVRTVEYDL